MAADKVAQADKLLKQANKLIGPSILEFRFKPDWEEAAPLYEKAALMYRQAGQLAKAVEVYERASQAQGKIGSPWHAAKHLETCADLSKQLANWEDVTKFYKFAADLYVEGGKHSTGADCLVRGARALEEQDGEAAMHLYYDALDIYESDGKEANATDTYRLAVACLIKSKKYGEAVELLMRFGAACDKLRARSSQCKAYLGAVVCHLYNKDPVHAWHTFQDCLQVDTFVSCDEAFAADALFTAYRSANPDEVKKVLEKKAAFKHLDAAVGRLARKLPHGDLVKQARKLNELLGGDEEEEGEEEEDPDAVL